MQQKIGIRELKNKTSSIVRRVREEAAEYVITHHGQPVAILRPISADDKEEMQKQESLDSWQTLLDLGALLTESALSAKPAVEILAEMREEENEWPS